MSLVDVNPGDLIVAQNLNQVIDALNGVSGKGQPVLLIALNDQTSYALSAQNLDPTNSRALNVVKSDGTLLIRADVNGVSLGTPLNLAAGSVQTAAVADQAITNQKLGPDTARANLLTNGGFEIWQRGNGPFAGGVFGPDRWLVQQTAPSTISVSRNTTTVDTGSGACAAITYTHAAGGSAAVSASGMGNDFPQVYGRTVSASVRVQASVANQVRLFLYDSVSAFRYGAYHPGGGAYQTLTVTAPFAAGAANAQLGISIENASGTIYVDNAMLVVGTVPATYAPLHPADDLARCLRYYENLGYGSGNGDIGASGLVLAGGTLRSWMAFKALKPVTPTVTKVGTWTVGNCTQPTVSGYISSLGFMLSAVGTNANTDTYFTNQTAGSYISVEANP